MRPVTAGGITPGEELLDQIQASISPALAGVREGIREVLQADLPLVREVNDHLLGMEGKLLRPSLLLLVERAHAESSREAVLAGSTLELVHLATLIHDDAIDGAVVRRGLATLNARWDHKLAVIAGDYLYSRALEAIVGLGQQEVLATVVEATHRMTQGEMLQLALTGVVDIPESQYYRLIDLKTASLFWAAARCGALLGGSDEAGQWGEFGRQLGVAFQIADDLMDYQGDVSRMGKAVGADLRERKTTLPLLGALRRATPGERARAEALFRESGLGEDEVKELVAMVEARGGLEYAREAARSVAEKALRYLEELPAGPVQAALELACEYVVDRDR